MLRSIFVLHAFKFNTEKKRIKKERKKEITLRRNTGRKCRVLNFETCLPNYRVCLTTAGFDAGLLVRSQYSEGPATGHLDTGFSWFSCVYKQMLRRFPRFQVATACFSCSPPDLNLLVTNFIFCIHVK